MVTVCDTGLGPRPRAQASIPDQERWPRSQTGSAGLDPRPGALASVPDRECRPRSQTKNCIGQISGSHDVPQSIKNLNFQRGFEAPRPPYTACPPTVVVA